MVEREGPETAADHRLLEAVRACEAINERAFFENAILPLTYFAVRGLNLAERARPSAERARAYAQMCFAAGVLPWHKLAWIYHDRAMAACGQ